MAYGIGTVDQAFSLDGVDDYVFIPNFEPFFLDGATFDAWVRPAVSPSAGNYFVIAVVGDSVQPTWSPMQCRMLYTHDLSPTTGLRFYMDCGINDENDYVYRFTANTYPPDGWHHVAGVFDDGTIHLYIDGQLDDGEQRSVSGAEINGLTYEYAVIGAQSNQDESVKNQYFQGLIDEVEIFDDALSSTDIYSIYAAQGAGKCKPCLEPPAGMQNWWTFDEEIGTTATDYAGTSPGTIAGAAWATGKVAGALEFDGVDDSVDVGDIDLGAAFTIDAWIYPDTLANAPFLVSKDDFASSRNYFLQYDSGGKLVGSVRNTASEFTQYRTNDVVLTPEAWNQVAFAYDGNASPGQKMRFYVNGANVPAAPLGGYDNGGAPADSDLNVKIGIAADGVTGAFAGLIDEVEIFNRVLGPEEIAALRAAGSAGKCLKLRVTTNATGTGTGTVTSSVGEINYAFPATTTGSDEFNRGESVVLTATANVGSTSAWPTCPGTTGGDSTYATCTLASLTAEQTAQAAFTATEADLPDLTGAWQSLHVKELYRKLFVSGVLKVQNIGSKSAGPFKVSYYLSDDGQTPGKFLGSASIKGLGKGARIQLAFAHAGSKSSLLGKYIIAIIDPVNRVAEASETNNFAAVKIW